MAEVSQLLPHLLHHVADVAHVVLLLEVGDVGGAVTAFSDHIPGERPNQKQRGSAGSSDDWHYSFKQNFDGSTISNGKFTSEVEPTIRLLWLCKVPVYPTSVNRVVE